MNELLSGTIKIKVSEQKGLSGADSRLIRENFHDGDVPNYVRFQCKIAEAANDAIANGIYSNGRFYVPNPKVRAQFGKNAKHVAFLTFGLIDSESGERITVTWTGDDIPTPMVKVAVAHDMGQDVSSKTIPLSLSSAQVYTTGINAKKDKRKNHDTDKNGKRYKRRDRTHHGRLSTNDVRVRDRRLKDSSK